MARNHSLKTFICFLLSSFYDRSIISIFSFVSKSSSSSLSSVQFSHPTASLQTKMGAFKVKLLVVKIAIPTERDVQPKSHRIMLWATKKVSPD
ncbi:hypothetical protein YC2023_038497 [Brassica napus]